MIDLLVISFSALTAINRAPYREMARRGWSVALAVPGGKRSTEFTREADPPEDGDPPITFLELSGSHQRWQTLVGLGDVLDRLKPRVILVDVDPGSLLSLQAGWWARRHGARLACISCDNLPRTFSGELRRSPGLAARFVVARSLAQMARLCVDHVFVLSEDGAETLAHVGFRDRVSVIPLGFDPAVFHPDAEARRRVRSALGLHSTTFAYIGRLIPEKGVDLLLRALHGIRDRPWQLLIDEFKTTTHPYAVRVSELISELGLRDRVVFFDAPHDRIADYMNAADVVVMPSISTPRWKEQYGRVAPEAMACGRLVIVSSCGSLPEVVGDAAVVIPEDDELALRQALGTILDDPAAIHRAAAPAVFHARAHHSLDVQCSRMASVFARWVPERASVPRQYP